MTRKWIAINLMLLAAAALLGWRLNGSVRRFKDENNVARLAKLQVPKKRSGAETGLAAARTEQKINDGDFAVIPAQNLFSDTRRMETKTETVAAPEPARKLDVIPVLVGVTIMGTRRMALISDPAAGNAPAGASRYQTMRLGDHYRGFVVTDITANSMVLEWGSSREVIPLYDTAKPPTQSGKTPIQPTMVVAFGGTGTGGMVVNSMAAQPSRVAVAGNSAQPAPASQRTQTGAAQRPMAGGQGANVPQPVAAGGGVSPGPTWNTTVDRQGNVIVNSPFGAFTLPPGQTAAQPVKK